MAALETDVGAITIDEIDESDEGAFAAALGEVNHDVRGDGEEQSDLGMHVDVHREEQADHEAEEQADHEAEEEAERTLVEYYSSAALPTDEYADGISQLRAMGKDDVVERIERSKRRQERRSTRLLAIRQQQSDRDQAARE